MAHPLQTAKQTVNLATSTANGGPRVSRIRRDPPPPVKETIVELEDRDQTVVVVGVLVFALAIFALVLSFGIYSAWSPSEYTIEINDGV
jgi:hypothetical protein